jgi:chemotaxis methyl-accepting protein methylase
MDKIISQVRRLSGRDISVYSDSFLARTISLRMTETSSENPGQYLKLLGSNPAEIELLLSSLNISYSLFFRNPIDYSIIEQFVLPSLLYRKGKEQKTSVRIWSAGCADGQEPYTLAIIGEDLAERLSIRNPMMVFATDLSEKALLKATVGAYGMASLMNLNLKQLTNCFLKTDIGYQVNEILKKQVEFSRYDLLDTKTGSPPSGIYGGFDMVLCCNVMVYYKREIQSFILEKLYRSLGSKGYLMVDQSEKSIVKSFGGFRLYSALCNIFVKI